METDNLVSVQWVTDKWKDVPTKTNNLGSDAISVSLGEQHTCAVLDTGVLKCWGRNNHGQIGVGSGGDKDTPQTVNVGQWKNNDFSLLQDTITPVPFLTTNQSSAGDEI